MPMTPEERQEGIIKMIESWLGPVDRELLAKKRAERLAAERSQSQQEPSSQEPPKMALKMVEQEKIPKGWHQYHSFLDDMEKHGMDGPLPEPSEDYEKSREAFMNSPEMEEIKREPEGRRPAAGRGLSRRQS